MITGKALEAWYSSSLRRLKGSAAVGPDQIVLNLLLRIAIGCKELLSWISLSVTKPNLKIETQTQASALQFVTVFAVQSTIESASRPYAGLVGVVRFSQSSRTLL